MIKRIVKLTFRKEEIENFKSIFRESKNKIVSNPGCHSVELLQSKKDKNIFFTYSIWTSEKDLDNYRHSDLFRNTWARTKVLFSEKPEAWTVESLGRVMG